MDRIGRVGHQHHVARRGDRLRHVGEAFLRAERRDDLGLGIELHAEAARVIAGLGAAQAGNALRGGIAVGARLADGLDQLVDDVLGRGQIGIAHAEIDDVGAGGAGLGLELVDLLEDVRRQPPRAVEVRHRVPHSRRAGLAPLAQRIARSFSRLSLSSAQRDKGEPAGRVIFTGCGAASGQACRPAGGGRRVRDRRPSPSARPAS